MALVALGTTAFALIWVMVQYQLVRGGRTAAAWYGTAVVVVAGPLLARTPGQLAAVMAVGCLTAVAAMARAVRVDRARPWPVVRPSALPRPAAGGVGEAWSPTSIPGRRCGTTCSTC